MIGIVLLLISATMLVSTAWLLAGRASREPGERFWFFIAAIVMQLGMYSLVLSWLEAFAPGPFLGLQAAVLLALALPHLLSARRRAAAADGLQTREPTLACIANWWGSSPFRRLAADPVSLALLIVIVGLLTLSGAQQWLTPLWGFDDRMYHAPRALYWIQNRSILPFETHNHRQTVFPFAVELSFAWSLLFAKFELPARMVFWLHLPATAVGMFLLARQIRIPRRYALAAALLYISTPTVLFHAVSVKPDAWLPLMAMGVAYFAIRATSRPHEAHRHWLGAGIFTACAVAVKTTALGLAPGLGVVLVSRLRPRNIAIGAGCVALGAIAGAILTGFASLAWWNTRDHGHPLGPPLLTKVVQPEMTWETLRTHAARLPLYLFEFPEIPEQPRRWILERKAAATVAMGADRRLLGEREHGWPGLFRPNFPSQALAYSLGGLLWLPLLLIGIIRVGREVLRRWRTWIRGRRQLFSPIAMLVIMQAPIFIGVVFAIRWMGAGPDRFWLVAYAMVVPVIAYFFTLWSRRCSLLGALGILLLIWAVYPSVRVRIANIEQVLVSPMPVHRLDEPYHHVTPLLGRRDVVLLFAGQASRDYPLFRPRSGYTTRIIPWGMREFDETAFQNRLEHQGITHILFEHDEGVGFQWAGGLRTAPFIAWLERDPDFEAVPLASDGTPSEAIRLFRRRERIGD